VSYLGICCGAGPHHVRAMAEAAGKAPAASRYAPDMSKHSFLGSADGIAQSYREYAGNL
jgi:betaine-homocysteine S-methyltransferase